MNSINFGDNKFCGPAVISAIAGIDTDEAERLLQELRHTAKPVKGVRTTEIVDVLQKLGFYTKYIHANRSVFLMLTLNSEPGYYIFMVPHHFILIEITTDGRRLLVDNHTKEPLNAAMSSRLGQQVWQAIRVWR